MKKVKIILTAVTVLSVVGGTLAFRAKNSFNTGDRYCSDTYTGEVCATSKDFISNPLSGIVASYCTSQPGTACLQQLENVDPAGIAGN